MKRIEDILKYESEGHLLDYKRELYDLQDVNKKHEFLKDISSMANNPSDEDKYLIFGVEEKNGLAFKFHNITSASDQALFQQYLDSYIEPSIQFEYVKFKHENCDLFYFRIFRNRDRPYLFKKDLIVTTKENKVKYCIGDGFIRTGTSTRKLNRSDLDEIYAKRHESRDRQADLKIVPTLKMYLFSTLFIIDFIIENLSNKSIGFDAELKLFYSKGVYFQKKFDYEEKNREKGLQSIYPQHYTPKMDSTVLFLNIKQRQDSYIVSRVGNKGEYAITISQNDSEESIFLEEILIGMLSNSHGDGIVSMELTLRSDDFKEGPLVMMYEFDLTNGV